MLMIQSMSIFKHTCNNLRWPPLRSKAGIQNFKFFGKYQILEFGKDWSSDLSAQGLGFFLVFHISQLKKSVGTRLMVTLHPPSPAVLWSILEKNIQRPLVLKGNHSITQGLIKWCNLASFLCYMGGFGVPTLAVYLPQHLELTTRTRRGGCYAR